MCVNRHFLIPDSAIQCTKQSPFAPFISIHRHIQLRCSPNPSWVGIGSRRGLDVQSNKICRRKLWIIILLRSKDPNNAHISNHQATPLSKKSAYNRICYSAVRMPPAALKFASPITRDRSRPSTESHHNSHQQGQTEAVLRAPNGQRSPAVIVVI